jgi:hypothetical protein
MSAGRLSNEVPILSGSLRSDPNFVAITISSRKALERTTDELLVGRDH